MFNEHERRRRIRVELRCSSSLNWVAALMISPRPLRPRARWAFKRALIDNLLPQLVAQVLNITVCAFIGQFVAKLVPAQVDAALRRSCFLVVGKRAVLARAAERDIAEQDGEHDEPDAAYAERRHPRRVVSARWAARGERPCGRAAERKRAPLGERSPRRRKERVRRARAHS